MTVDYAELRHRDAWLHHPVIGDPSWDAFLREPKNPIYTGDEPFPWPVNGTLFHDPISGKWYAYISQYSRGYWPIGGVVVLQEAADGTWHDLGVCVDGDANFYDFDGKTKGGTVDASVVYDAGRYHMIYGWTDTKNTRGGLGYAWASSPEGPFTRTNTPITNEADNTPVMGIYYRCYASTLLRRKHDWLILHMMSVEGNAGGTWALAAMMAPCPEGPYSTPRLLIYPQSEIFHPPLAEFFPQFLRNGIVYAPATSVAKNRSFQILYSAPLEEAHEPDAWRLDEMGSLWHDVAVPHEHLGIWGQTLAAVVDPTSGNLRALHFSRDAKDRGTVGVSSRPWNRPFRENGFTLSAPNAPAVGILENRYREFTLHLTASASGPWTLCWDCRGPLGANHPHADSEIHPLMRTDRIELRLTASTWELLSIGTDGQMHSLSHGECKGLPTSVKLDIQHSRRSSITLDGEMVWLKHLPVLDGKIEILAEKGTILDIEHCYVAGEGTSAPEMWLASEAIAGAGAVQGQWREVEDPLFRYGRGYVSTRPGARAKFNISGSAVRLYAPKGPDYGRCKVLIDGKSMAEIDLHSAITQHSAPVFEQVMEPGRHAVTILAQEGLIVCDCLEITP